MLGREGVLYREGESSTRRSKYKIINKGGGGGDCKGLDEGWRLGGGEWYGQI